MASLIGGQREGQGQDPFTSYLKTFTPSYSAYDEPFTPEEYEERSRLLAGCIIIRLLAVCRITLINEIWAVKFLTV